MKSCLRCGKNYVRLELHAKNKAICQVKYLDIDRIEMVNNYDNYLEDYKKLIVDKFECENCGILFTRKSSYYRHKNHRCKMIPKNTTQPVSNDLQPIANTVNNITNNNNNTINGNINNGTINTNITIVLKNFGEESNLPVEQVKQLLNECIKGKIEELLTKYIKKMWIDNEENNNINVLDISRGIAEIYKDNEWQKTLLNEVTDTVRVKSSNNIEGYIENKKKELVNAIGHEYTNKPVYQHMNKVWNHLDDINDNK